MSTIAETIRNGIDPGRLFGTPDPIEAHPARRAAPSGAAQEEKQRSGLPTEPEDVAAARVAIEQLLARGAGEAAVLRMLRRDFPSLAGHRTRRARRPRHLPGRRHAP